MKTDAREKPKNPRRGANPLSIITFAWFVPTFIKGYKKTLDEDDLFDTLPEHESAFLGDKLEEAWKKETLKDKPSFRRALFRVFGTKILMFGIVTVLNELVFKVAQTLALGKLIYYYTPNQTEITRQEAFLYAGIIALCSFIMVICGHNYVMGLQHLGMKMRVACCSLIYRKSLKMSKGALAETTTGQMINLLSNDVNRFDFAIINVHNFWVAPLQMCLIMYLVYRHVGWTGIIGVCFILAFLPLQIYLGKRSSVLRLRIAIRTDERVRLMNEIITGIQVIKMYAWEAPFAKLVALTRRLEINEVRGTAYVRGTILSFTNFLGSLALFFSVLTYTLTGNIVRAEYVFVISSFYNILRQSMTIYLPNGITQCAEALVSIGRLQNFLLLEEREPPRLEQNGYIAEKDVGLEIEKANAKWIALMPENTLTDISFTAHKGELIAIIGYVGNGKTSLLHIILKELPLLSGSLSIRGSISYAAQESWLFCGSVRENILFGQPYDEARYRKVMRVCALERDFSLLQHGDSTIVGERGVTLSGGQKARINLARAVYKDCDIYLLDDPLAAVDTHVSKQLFDECISEFLKDKCVILVTNQLQFLKSVKKIILLERGTVVASGNYQELQESGLDFAKLLEGEVNEEEAEPAKENQLNYDYSDTQDLKLIESKESRFGGSIGTKIYGSYFKAGGSPCIVFMLGLLFIVAQISSSGTDYFLSYWTNLEQTKAVYNITRASQPEYLTRDTTLYIYAAIVTFTVFIFLTRSFAFFSFSMRSSIILHDRMFSKVVKAPMRFFNRNSSGRILNRFSKDMGAIDEILPVVIVDTFQIGLKVLGITGVVASVNPWLLLVSGVILAVFYVLRHIYLATSRNVKRLEGVTRSPVFTHINTSLQGLTTIRAFGAQEMLRKQFDKHQDLHSSAWFMFLGSSRSFGFWLDLICVVYIATVTLNFLIIGKEQYAGNVGLAITQAIMLTGSFQWGMRQWSELENQMTAVERVVEYTKLETEEREDIQKKPPPVEWPEKGEIEFKYVSLRYSMNDPYVLKNLNFSIGSEEKVGIVGRTGAGKSSLISALFQLTPIEGEIIIDHKDISNYPFDLVRSKISIIPQDPVLFSGTLRKNLDPFNEYSDEALWSALADVELKNSISETPSMLNTNVSEGGTNFSVGQRQLLCLARTIVRKNKILVLDEATANVDPKTDSLIQQTIRQKFRSCTVLTIAHRLNTVMDSDKILVMDAGEVKEFDHPYVLLQERGMFYGMVQQMGKAMADSLSKIAELNYNSKR